MNEIQRLLLIFTGFSYSDWALTRNNGCTNFNRQGILVLKKRLSKYGPFFLASNTFLQTKVMQNNFHVFEELVSFAIDLSRTSASGIEFQIWDSGFQVLGTGQNVLGGGGVGPR